MASRTSELAEGMNSIPKVRLVLDAQISRLDNSTAPKGYAVNEVSKLKEQLKGEIVVPVAAS